jgi:Icc-related predicted phosphoesterase
MKPDFVLLLGDIDSKGVQRIDKAYDCPKYGVLGNHDVPSTFSNSSVMNIHGKVVEHNGLKIAGFGGCPRYNRKSGQYTEEEARQFIETLGVVDIFIAHANPMWTFNDDPTDPHRGFQAFAEYIYEKKPVYFLHGHLHSNETYMVGRTMVCCVYPYKEFWG